MASEPVCRITVRIERTTVQGVYHGVRYKVVLPTHAIGTLINSLSGAMLAKAIQIAAVHVLDGTRPIPGARILEKKSLDK